MDQALLPMLSCMMSGLQTPAPSSKRTPEADCCWLTRELQGKDDWHGS
jgi:hypothetical protein